MVNSLFTPDLQGVSNIFSCAESKNVEIQADEI